MIIMTSYRIFVEKKEPFRVEAESLREDLNSNLGLNIKDLRLINIYDLFGFNQELKDKTSYKVFGEPATDIVSEDLDINENLRGETLSIEQMGKLAEKLKENL